jgi:hypothetical protein
MRCYYTYFPAWLQFQLATPFMFDKWLEGMVTKEIQHRIVGSWKFLCNIFCVCLKLGQLIRLNYKQAVSQSLQENGHNFPTPI